MTHVQRSALLPYSAAQMYQLVNDIDSYPEFVPWCVNTEIHKEEELEKHATMYFARKAIKTSVTTKNALVKDKSISMNLVSGPFKQLAGDWNFKSIDENACKVELDLKFDFSNKLYEITLGPVFNQVANKLVSAFSARAKQLYG